MGTPTLPEPTTDSVAVPGRAVALPLTFKGFIACLVLVLYGGVMAAYILGERQARLRQIEAMDGLQAREEGLKRAGLAVSNALLALRQAGGEGSAEAPRNAIPYALEAAGRALSPWQEHVPAAVTLLGLSRQRLAAMSAEPSRADLLELRESVETLARELERQELRAGAERVSMAREFRAHGDRIAVNALALGLGGMVVFGGITALFFVRLAGDLRILGQRAKDIVSGYRGEPLEVTRRDEVGVLIRDVNQMAATLAARERELGVAQERRAHRDKMAALGAMAHVLSHEIGNPLANIAAIAQAASATRGEAATALQPEEILRQTERIARMTRQIADFSGPRRDAPGLVDIGGALGVVCDFMQYDPRFRATRIEVRLPEALPMLLVVPDQLNEMLMSLLLLAVDGEAAPPRVEVAAQERGNGVVLLVPAVDSPANAASRERVRQLAEGMGGLLAEPREGAVEVTLPAAQPPTAKER